MPLTAVAAPSFEFSAGGIVIDAEGRVLCIRTRNLKGETVWTLPKGGLGEGETSQQAALREVREETGWECTISSALDPVTYWYQREGRRIKKTVRWFRMTPKQKVGDHDPHEVDEVAWLSVEDTHQKLTYPSDRKLIDAAVAAR